MCRNHGSKFFGPGNVPNKAPDEESSKSVKFSPHPLLTSPSGRIGNCTVTEKCWNVGRSS